MLKKIIILSFITILFSNSNIEEYIYDVEIKGILAITGKVGNCNLKIIKNKNNEYEMSIITKTTNFAKILFPYIDTIKLKINKYFSLISLEQNISSSKKILKVDIDKTNKTITRNGKKLSFYADTLFSPYSLIYFLKNNDIKLNNKYSYNLFDGKKIKEILFSVLKIEKVSVPYGSFDCFNIIPITDENLIKNNGMIELWYSADENKFPIKIMLKTKIGTFIMKLKDIK